MTIDVCKIFGPDAVFLQQAAHLTGGSYIYLERRDALLQHLLVSALICLKDRFCNIISADDVPAWSFDAANDGCANTR